MKGIRQTLVMLVMLAGVLSLNAIPFVPHHHHDGKICVEQQDESTGEHDGGEEMDVHSEEGDYDLPQDDMRIGTCAVTFVLSLFNEKIEPEENLRERRERQPERNEVFTSAEFSAESHALRGSPSIS